MISSPINAAKAVKNEVEIQGFYNGNLRDSVAMVSFFLCFRACINAFCKTRWYGWLEEQIVKKKAPVTEYEAQRKLSEYRSMEKYWAGDCNFIRF